MTMVPALPSNSRLRGLSQAAIQSVIAAAQALELGHSADADVHIRALLASYPDHPEILRLAGGLYSVRGEHAQAIIALQRAVDLRPDDALYRNTLGSALIQAGIHDVAIETLRRACELDPNLAVAWFNLGLALMHCMRPAESAAALRRATELAPDQAAAHVILGDMLRAAGRVDEAVAQFRRVLTRQPQAGMAWWGLADTKTVRLGADDIAHMQRILRAPGLSDPDHVAIGFALAKALEDQGEYTQSLDALAEANARARRHRQWNAAAHSIQVDGVLNAFAHAPVGPDSTLGHEVIFIASMPRSGSTLIEQVLASHSHVDGAGELPDLPMTLTEESRRRGLPFPQWVGAMQAQDWERLGRRYLERTAYWRQRHPRFVDKLPYNWLYVGAIRAMLPGARIVLARRDPLETCFSCYRQHLADNEYTRTFADLAAFWRDFDSAARHWSALHPAALHENVYENLIADPENSIRQLLAFCALPFEPGCVTFHETVRDVHTPSAMQVREPLRHDTARSARYGRLLDPLRAALGVPLFSSSSG
jgi:tetratricopeptide (TPR) repeat protein